jgi:hypothetical protein
MNRIEIINQLEIKYKEIFSKYWSFYMKKLEQSTNIEILKIYNYLDSNIKYIEKYISILNIQNEELIQKDIDKNNFIKELNDTLYEPIEKKQFINNPKIHEFD